MLLLVLVVAAGARAAAAADLCSLHLIPSNTTYMQFTKEPVALEYGFQGQFKSIHCCVKGYRSIEWFKDGIPYPWPAGLSNLILYPEAGNQTLYVRRASRSDSGEYICRVSNQTHTQDHLITLQIFSKVTNAPRTMYVSQDQSVEEGAPLRLFCEALVERTHLADAVSDLKWKRVWPNGTEGDLLPTQKEINTSREDVPNIYGSYLMVDRVSPDDYGKFVCVAHSNNVPVRSYVVVSPPLAPEEPWHVDSVPWRGLALGGGALACVALAVAVLHRRCTPRLRLLVRRARALATTPAQRARVLGKEFDVLVCWTPVDRELVRGALLPTLQYKYKYRVHGVQVPTEPDNWYHELEGECARCRALVAVLSPAQYSAAQLLTSLRQLRALPMPPVVVLLQDLPDLKREAKDSGETLVNILRRTRLIPWRSLQDREFWTQLRLALPLPPPSSPPPASPQHTGQNPIPAETDDNTNSRSGSLTALVV